MIKMAIEVTFETARPLTQTQGLSMWELGKHFAAAPGKARYRLKSEGEADSIVDGVTGLIAQIERVVADDTWPEVIVVEAHAKTL